MQKLAEKIKAGQARAAALGRKPGRAKKVPDDQIRAAIPLGTVKGAAKAGLSVSTFIRRRRQIEENANANTEV